MQMHGMRIELRGIDAQQAKRCGDQEGAIKSKEISIHDISVRRTTKISETWCQQRQNVPVLI